MSEDAGPPADHPTLVVLSDRAGEQPHPDQRLVLDQEVAVIGSDPSCDLRLAGLDPRHAVVRRDEEADDYLIVALARFGDTLVNGEPVDTTVLRGNARVQLGGWRMIYRDDRPGHLAVSSADA